MWRQLVWILTLWGCFGSVVLAQPLELVAGRDRFSVAGHLLASGPQAVFARPEDALASMRRGEFQKLPGFLGRGFNNKEAVWIAFDVRNPQAQAQSLVVQVGPANLDFVSAWQIDSAGQLTPIGKAGDQVPASQVELAALKPSFGVQMAAASSTTVLLRIQTAHQLVAFVNVFSSHAFPSAQATEGILLGGLGAAFLITSAVALATFWVLRERIYLLWLILILAMAGHIFMQTGLGYRYVDWLNQFNVNRASTGFAIAAMVANLLFADALFEFKSLNHWLHRVIIVAVVAVIVVPAVGSANGWLWLSGIVVSFFFLLLILVGIGIITQIIRRHPESVRYGPVFLLSYVASSFGIAVQGFSWFPFTESASMISSIMNVCNLVSLQVAMFVRVNKSQRQSAEVRLQLLNQLTQHNQELEVRVQQRTESLSAALQDVQQAEASQRQLLAMASHEFRTPAASIKASLDSLAILNSQVPPEVASRLVNMRSASVRMIDLANDLINEDRLHELSLKPHLVKIDLRALAQDVMARYADNSVVVADLGTGSLHITADAALIGIAMHNLVDNALRHGKPAKAADQVITVTLDQVGNFVEFHVADNGPGIPDIQKEWVFERYHAGPHREYVDGNDKWNTSSGLGLAIVRHVAKAHSGVALATDNVPSGAILTLRLPI